MTTTSPRPVLVQLAMALTMILWGVSFVASKIVLASLTPLTYMGIRFLLASVVLGIVLLLRGRPGLTGRQHVLIGLTALAEPISYFLFETYGLTLTSATTASLIIATIPLMVMLFAGMFLGEPVSPRSLIAVIVSIGGIALLVAGAPSTEPLTPDAPISEHLAGVLLIFGAVISAAAYITLARHISRSTDTVSLTVFQTWWGAAVFGVLRRIQSPPARAVLLPPSGWFALTFLVLGATLGAFLLYNWALRYETAGRAALYINGIPVVTAITAWVILDERLTLLQLLGAVLVIISVRIATQETKQ